MKRFLLFSLALAACVMAIAPAATKRRGSEALAASPRAGVAASLRAHLVASQSAQRSAASPPGSRSSSTPSQRPRAARAGSAPSANFAVREIDTAALTALLRRDGEGRNRPLLVNFWATWCIPCREEFPDLVRIDNEFRPRGLEFFTVSLDEPAEITTTVPQFLREMRATGIPAYLLNAPEPADAITAVDPAWGGGLPATFLYDARGQLVFKHTGRIRPAELRAAIERAISAR